MAGWRDGAAIAGSAGLVLALIAGAALLAAGPGYRFGWWSLGTAFLILRLAIYGGAAAVVLAAIGLVAWWRGRGSLVRPVAGLAIGLVVVGVPLSLLRTAQGLPPIHDISTDLDDPPRFEAVVPLRGEGANPHDARDADLAAQQREAYPCVGPILTGLRPAEAFARALAGAEAMGWRIVAADPAVGRIEAVDRTLWFGFEDDIVIRVRPDGDGARIDVRSLSRVGISDLGTNAARIRAYAAELEPRLAAP
jgi:uncharacterized protein (DUF1499 family)